MFMWSQEDKEKVKSFSFFSLIKTQNYRKNVFIFTPLQIADVKASCCHGGMPGGFIVIAALLSCSWCPYDCDTAQKISRRNNKLPRRSLKVHILNINS